MINVIGLGYIGLPTALMLASHGVEVIGTDYNKELVDTLNAGKTTLPYQAELGQAEGHGGAGLPQYLPAGRCISHLVS